MTRQIALPSALLLLLALPSCRGEAEGDPAAVDAHLNQSIRDQEAERRRLVEAARRREEGRAREMEANVANYSGD